MAAVTSFENTLYHVYPCMCPEEWGILSSPGSGGEFKPEASSFLWLLCTIRVTGSTWV